MEYQKIIYLLDSTPNQPFKFGKKNWAERNHVSHGTYNTNSQIEFKTSLKSSFCNYSDAYILVRGTITLAGEGAYDAARQTGERTKEVIFQNCISKISNT